MATLKDIAAAVQLDASTVSRALNGSDRVKPETREVVLEVAREMGYVPNLLARQLRRDNATRPRARTGIIAFLMRRESIDTWHPEDRYKSRLFAAVHREFNARNQMMLVHGYDRDADLHCPPIADGRVDGVLGRIEDDHVARAIARQLPLVLLHTRTTPLTEQRAVNTDVERGVWQLTRHLAELGHRQVAYFHPVDKPGSPSEQHAAACFSALRHFQMEMPETFRQPRQVTSQTHNLVIQRFVQELLPLIRQRQITALVTSNDIYAATAWRHLEAAGIRVPGDLSITGFDGRTHVVEGEQQGLTTVAHDFPEMVRQAMDALEQGLDGTPIPSGETRIHPQLILSRSTGPASTS